jgi:stage V sporulation protein G
MSRKVNSDGNDKAAISLMTGGVHCPRVTRRSRSMQISEIRVRELKNKGRMKAIVSITFDNMFVVHDIKVIEGDNGLFIAMPSRLSSDGKYRDIAHPITLDTRKWIEDSILKKYEEVTKQNEGQTGED